MFGVGRQNKLVTTFSAFFDGGILGLTGGFPPPPKIGLDKTLPVDQPWRGDHVCKQTTIVYG